ncbi:hypothetical protein Stsp02_28280 [Streptomyces sp. NBRC 14336]|uniref:phytoene/squalene synthase family protein n=1 Tax=Streptomyces sp. NBRC 14336 TaxID=3030992 RepID=UPI0024A18621|nr:squalene/phytoene synthase family protein [Streptomyces sp. NBRC 14336]GLW47166.1 hypothetical protein Stsp02_28280 [Streptomyces sp. NBRC 14336]
MTRWSTVLTRAGVREPLMRADYDAQRRVVRRFEPHAYLAARLLLPPRLHAPVVAAVAFMHLTDELIDAGEVSARQQALHAWDRQVTQALEERSDNSGLRALADTVQRHPQLASRVRDFLDGAAVEASWTAFATEADFQAYVDQYSLPALLLTASLVAPAPDSERYAPFLRCCRDLIEGWQRLDNLADLREDAERDQVGIPLRAFAEHGLKPEELLAQSPDAVAVGRLVSAQAALAGDALSRAQALPELVDAEFRPFVRTLVSVQELRLEVLRHKGAAVLTEDVRPPVLAAVRVLGREALLVRRPRRR